MSTSALKNFLSDKRDGVFIIGHAGALARVAGMLILFDPIWDRKPYGDYWHFSPEQINCDKILDKVDACFVSHIHEDHCCMPILERLDKIFIMDGLQQLASRIGNRVVKAPTFTWFSYMDLQYFFVPHPFNNVDSSVFVRNPKTGYTIYVGNDNFLSSAQCMDLATKYELASKIHTALVPYAFIHWYPHLVKNMTADEKAKEFARLKAQSMGQARAFRSILQPKYIIPTGNSLFYADSINHPLNAGFSSPYDFKGALPLLAGDYIFDDGEHSEPRREIDFELQVEADCTSCMWSEEKHCTVYPGVSHIQAMQKKVSRATFRIPNYEIIVNTFVFDCETLNVRIGSPGTKPHMHFEVEPWEYRQWIDGELSLEQVIGTRRFVVTRSPNEYRPEVFRWFNENL